VAYDISGFMDRHPGGQWLINLAVGRDATGGAPVASAAAGRCRNAWDGHRTLNDSTGRHRGAQRDANTPAAAGTLHEQHRQSLSGGLSNCWRPATPAHHHVESARPAPP
jgi:hypothetical protein